MSEQLTMVTCSNIGLSGAQVYIEEVDNQFEARQAVAIFGSYQMKESDLEEINYNPFHNNFYDNFVSGTGKTKEDAIAALKADAESMCDSLWAF